MAPKRKVAPKTSIEERGTAATRSSKRKMATSTREPQDAVDTSEPIYFWREYGSEHCFLSQWYKSEFTSDDDDQGIVYKNAEQYMMYQKAMLFEDKIVADEILGTTDPKTIKALGRQVKPFEQDKWLANRERIVGDGSYFKFKNGKAFMESEYEDGKWEKQDLKKALLDTGDRELVEASPFDKIWGIGFGPDKVPEDRKRWGLNLLGKALMAARTKLREEEQAAATNDK